MKTTINKKLVVIAIALLGMIIPTSMTAQDKFEVSLGADFVNKYVWRGFDQGSGASIQPSLGLAWKGVSLTAWGSTSITALEPKEFDISLGYSIGGLSICLTDYWWNGENGNYGYYKDSHFYEGAVSYCFGEKVPLTLSAAIMFAGDKNPVTDKKVTSCYFNASYDINCPGDIILTPSVGVSTKSYMYADKKISGFTDIALKATKDIKITESFAVPIFAQVIVSPVMDKTYLVFGMSF